MTLDNPTILIVDDEHSVRVSMSMSLEGVYRILTCGSGEECLEIVKKENIDLILLDLRMEGISGEETLEEVKKIDSSISVIIISAYADVSKAVQCMKLGAYDIMTKPVDLIHLEGVIRNIFSEKGLSRKVEILQEELQQFRKYENLVSSSKAMAEVILRAEKVGQLETDGLLIGETGTGKELIAELIHSKGKRAHNPFIIVDCASMTQSLAASTLFGHEKGAFTGAVTRKIGKFELAQGGIVFLDEIAHLPKEIQPFLLRILESRIIQRVGGNANVKLDVQIIAATNRNLKDLVERGNFIQDLYYRLMTVPIEIPPLRERPEDVPTLAYHFLKQLQRKYDCRMQKIDEGAVEIMQEYPWPGNVRELRYIIENIVVISGNEEILRPYHLPNEISDHNIKSYPIQNPSEMAKTIQEVEKSYIINSLEKTGGNISQSAKELGLGRNTLYRKMKAYNIDPANLLCE